MSHFNAPPELGGPPARVTWKGAVIKDKSLWFKAGSGTIRVKLNPVVTILSALLIIAFILWCVLEPDRESSC